MNKKIFIFLCCFIMISTLISSEKTNKDYSGKWSVPAQVFARKEKKQKGKKLSCYCTFFKSNI